MADDQHYDVVIIRTGAGGGTLGHRLATNDAKVLWLLGDAIRLRTEGCGALARGRGVEQPWGIGRGLWRAIRRC